MILSKLLILVLHKLRRRVWYTHTPKVAKLHSAESSYPVCGTHTQLRTRRTPSRNHKNPYRRPAKLKVGANTHGHTKNGRHRVLCSSRTRAELRLAQHMAAVILSRDALAATAAAAAAHCVNVCAWFHFVRVVPFLCCTERPLPRRKFGLHSPRTSLTSRRLSFSRKYEPGTRIAQLLI